MNEVAGIPAQLMQQPESPRKNTMGKDDFMKLLMAQLKYQDPLKPMDHQEFATQLAQFGQLEQLTNIGSGIQGLKSGQGEGSKLQALGMIGKKVEAAQNDFDLAEGQAVELRSNLDPTAKPLAATVFDANGKVVRELDLAGKGPTDAIAWDGKDQEGQQLPTGKYSFRVHGADKDGKPVDGGTELSGQVTGVEMEGANPLLVVKTAGGTTKLELSKVKKVIGDAPTQENLQAPINKPQVKAQPVQMVKKTEEPATDFPDLDDGWPSDVGERGFQGILAGLGGVKR